MSKKDRPSVLKREREQKKREREARKAKKAALKRARREGHAASQSGPSPTQQIEGQRVAADPSTETNQ
ncbi:MAG: hypothetical protein ACYTFA_16165 [Planctomycetota bacterium]|jgi:hypothetical protein